MAIAGQSPRRLEVVQQVERLIESQDDKLVFVARPPGSPRRPPAQTKVRPDEARF